MPFNKKAILNALPDMPRWVEARAMLINGRGMILGFEEVKNQPPTGALYQEDIGLGVIIGKPSTDLIFQLSELADEVICPEEYGDHFSEVFLDWTYEGADIYQQKTENSPSINAPTSPRLLNKSDLNQAKGIPKPLYDELLEELTADTEIFFASTNNRPVSFCLACAKTEKFWSVSIETIAKYQRQGFARQCFHMASQEMQRQDLSAVWATIDSNIASKAMVESLGFEPKDRLRVFTRKT